MTIVDIDTPGFKEILWHRMRGDLSSYLPQILDTDRLICPMCGRFLPFDEFTLEHIIPQQTLADDPADVRATIPKNERAVLTLLCKRRLLLKGKRIYDNGCNSWKGRFYDRYLRETFSAKAILNGQFNVRHQITLFITGYLGVFAKYGYQVALSRSGITMREQFFNPNKFIQAVPLKCQIVLTGQPLEVYRQEDEVYWKPPFKISWETGMFCIGMRNTSLFLPMARDPELPIAQKLRYVPQKYSLRPDFRTAFH
jgi:hypothetical protein